MSLPLHSSQWVISPWQHRFKNACTCLHGSKRVFHLGFDSYRLDTECQRSFLFSLFCTLPTLSATSTSHLLVFTDFRLASVFYMKIGNCNAGSMQVCKCVIDLSKWDQWGLGALKLTKNINKMETSVIVKCFIHFGHMLPPLTVGMRGLWNSQPRASFP